MSMSPATEPRLVVLDTALLARGPGTGAGGAPALAWQMDVVTGGEDELVRDFVSAETGALLLGYPLVHGARDRRVFDGRSSIELHEIVAAGARQWLDEAGPIAGVTIDPADAGGLRRRAGRVRLRGAPLQLLDQHAPPRLLRRSRLPHPGLRQPSRPPDGSRAARPRQRAGTRAGRTIRTGEYSGAFFFDLGMVAKDIFAHEYTHAVLDFATRSAPVYASESGAVEEAIADTFAALLEESDQPWTLGETTVAGATRSFADPHESTPWQPACYQERSVPTPQGSCNPDPCRARGTYCVESQCLYDAGGVHINSGIGARALYLMTQGSAGVPFDAPCELHDAPPILDRPKVAAFYALAVGLVDEHVSFFDLRAYVLAACRLLAEEHVTPLSAASEVTTADCAAVINAFASVGIGDPDTDLDGWDDREDNCPMVANDQADADDDDHGDACDDDAPECGECAGPRDPDHARVPADRRGRLGGRRPHHHDVRLRTLHADVRELVGVHERVQLPAALLLHGGRRRDVLRVRLQLRAPRPRLRTAGVRVHALGLGPVVRRDGDLQQPHARRERALAPRRQRVHRRRPRAGGIPARTPRGVHGLADGRGRAALGSVPLSGALRTARRRR
ncbi:MAG: M4 family metallopeptidase [Sandaracinaceae bacterium]|nr:M4 family metallopeptidase [Sandaracinaceae bacterium]